MRIFKVAFHFIIDAIAFQGPIVIQSLESVLASFQQTLRLPYLEATAGGLFVDSVPTDQGDVAWFVRCAKQCAAVFLVPDGLPRSHGSYCLKFLKRGYKKDCTGLGWSTIGVTRAIFGVYTMAHEGLYFYESS